MNAEAFWLHQHVGNLLHIAGLPFARWEAKTDEAGDDIAVLISPGLHMTTAIAGRLGLRVAIETRGIDDAGSARDLLSRVIAILDATGFVMRDRQPGEPAIVLGHSDDRDITAEDRG